MTDLAEWMSAHGLTEMSFPGSEHSFVSGSAAHRPIRVSYRSCATAAAEGSLLAQQVAARTGGKGQTKHAVLLLAEYCFTPLCQGPPGHAHGGSIAAALDELMGGVGWINGFPVLARKIEVDFVKPVKIGSSYYGCAAITSKTGRKLAMTAVVLDDQGVLVSAAEGLFIELEKERLQALLGVAG